MSIKAAIEGGALSQMKVSLPCLVLLDVNVVLHSPIRSLHPRPN